MSKITSKVVVILCFCVVKCTQNKIEQLVQSDKYPVESHYFTTTDGYILNLIRILSPTNDTNKVALLVHGLLASPADFLITGSHHAVAYELNDNGFDVWLLSNRGTTESLNHTILSSKGSDYWNFSWHEIGAIDIPETIDYILNSTGQKKLYYIGHSQGTTVLYVMSSQRPEYNEKIKLAISLAPVAFMKYIKNLGLRTIAFAAYWLSKFNLSNVINFLIFSVDKYFSLLPQNNIIVKTVKNFDICGKSLTVILCQKGLDLIAGYNPKTIKSSFIRKILEFYPAGASIKQALHYLQEVVSGQFSQYDYYTSNRLHYGSDTPPKYNLSRVTFPNYLFWSNNDILSSAEDVKMLCKGIGKACKLISFEGYGHLDYVYSHKVTSILSSKLLKILNVN